MMYGIECFVSTHHSFSGNIKTHSSDFEVREMDMNGVIADGEESILNREIENSDYADTPISDQHASFTGRSSKIGSMSQMEQSFVTSEVYKFDDTPNVHQSINRMLDNSCIGGHKITGQRQAMHKQFKSELKQSQLTINENPEEVVKSLISKSDLDHLYHISSDNEGEQTVNIGVVNDKIDRTKMHQCIRYLFPHLRTSVIKNDTGDTVITVSKDFIYKEFLEAGMSKECADRFFKFVNCQMVLKDKSTFIAQINGDKSQRTNIHRLIRFHFGSFLESKTFSGDNGTDNSINVRFRQKRPSHTSFPSHTPGDVYRFVLCKRNVETSDALARLSVAFKTKSINFSYAGSKDKKAITYQNITVRDIDFADLNKIARQLKGGDLEVTNIVRVKEMLRLGDLRGNVFKIIVRNITSKRGEHLSSLIDTAVNNVKMNGFVNYFGTQRFGFEESTVSSPVIGLAMLKQDFVRAVSLILSPTGQCPDSDEAKRHFQATNDVIATLKIMPSWRTREITILKALKQHGFSDKGCQQALLSLSYHVRLMYVHSYCSLLWNRMATKRLQMFGLNVVDGDSVELSNHSDFKIIDFKNDSADECKISQVVLPLPGFRIGFPSHLSLEYENALKRDGLSRSNFRIRKLRLNVPGVYRKLLSYPENMTWKFRCMKDDMQKMERSTERPREGANLKDQAGHGLNPINVEFQFSLKAASYATICLREVMNQ
ncbi:pseudouridylate synthase PUS7L-like isoform X2 [Rhopilema esculentum]